MNNGAHIASELEELESTFSCEDDELELDLVEEVEPFLFFLLLLRPFLSFLFLERPLRVSRGSSPFSAAVNNSEQTWSVVFSEPSLSQTRYCLVSSAAQFGTMVGQGPS